MYSQNGSTDSSSSYWSSWNTGTTNVLVFRGDEYFQPSFRRARLRHEFEEVERLVDAAKSMAEARVSAIVAWKAARNTWWRRCQPRAPRAPRPAPAFDDPRPRWGVSLRAYAE